MDQAIMAHDFWRGDRMNRVACSPAEIFQDREMRAG